MSKTASFKVIKRLEEKFHARSKTDCPTQYKNLSYLILSHCAYYGHPQVRGEERCFCKLAIAISCAE